MHTALHTQLCNYLAMLLLITLLSGDACGNTACVGFGLEEMEANSKEMCVCFNTY